MRNIQKIVMYIDVMYRGGAQRVMANLANYLSEKSLEVILVNDFEGEPGISQYYVSEKVRRFYLRKNLSGNFLIKNLERIVALRNLIKEEKPEVVLSFLGRPNQRMLISTIGLPCKKIVSVRNDPCKEYGESSLKKKFVNLLFHLADGYVFQTEDALQYFDNEIQSNSVVILNPVDSKFFTVEREQSPRHIITVGRLEAQKNHKLLISAFSIIKSQFPDVNLIIFGEGSLRNSLEIMIKDLKLTGRVFLPGNTEDVEQKLASAKVFVLSSDYEGLPNALMEAMAAGVPCISTDCPCGGPKMLIKDQSMGILVKCGNVEQMTEALTCLLSNKKNLDIGKAAKQRAKEFSSEIILKKWEDYLIG